MHPETPDHQPDLNPSRLCSYLIDEQFAIIMRGMPAFFSASLYIAHEGGHLEAYPRLVPLLKELGERIRKYCDFNEHILFPYLRLQTEKREKNLQLKRDAPVSREIHQAHQEIVSYFAKLRELTSNYQAPENASPVLKLCYARIFNYEQDLLKYVYLEEDILFYKLNKLLWTA